MAKLVAYQLRLEIDKIDKELEVIRNSNFFVKLFSLSKINRLSNLRQFYCDRLEEFHLLQNKY